MILFKNLLYVKLIVYKKFSKLYVFNFVYVINICFKCLIFFSIFCERRLINLFKRKYYFYFINKVMVCDFLFIFNILVYSFN